MDLTALVIVISGALASVAVVTFRALPPWVYRMPFMKRKPFTCESCLAFWFVILMLLGPEWIRMPFYALAASAISCFLWKVSQN